MSPAPLIRSVSFEPGRNPQYFAHAIKWEPMRRRAASDVACRIGLAIRQA